MTEVKFRGDLGANSDSLFKALSDGTRRALLEYLVREGEQNVVALTAVAGVSQPMVSRHMGKLKRETWFAARTKGLGPVVQWMAIYGALWSQRFTPMEHAGD
ncbi:MAG: transcriptional regulator [Sphingobium sp.]|nr:MAG: transcriptional regulator [Sphingobium sp.]